MKNDKHKSPKIFGKEVIATSPVISKPKRGTRRSTPNKINDIKTFDNPWPTTSKTPFSDNSLFKTRTAAKGRTFAKATSNVGKILWCEAFDISPWVASNAERKKAPWKLFPSRNFRLKHGYLKEN